MQPDTAFWILSATAQSSAALAGLSAVLWVFFMQGFGDELRRRDRWLGEDEGEYEEAEERSWALGWLIRASSLSTAFFIFALITALLTLGVVNPGLEPIPDFQFNLVWLSVGLALVGGSMMVVFTLSTRPLLFRRGTH